MDQPGQIIILDDHPLVATALADVCRSLGWQAVPTMIATPGAFKKLVLEPDSMYIIDMRIGEDDGRVVIKYIKQHQPDARIMAFSSYDDSAIIQSALSAGASQYMIKNAGFAEMKQALLALWNREHFVHPSIWHALTKPATNLPKSGTFERPRLTVKEKEILSHILNEKTTKEIAAIMFLSEKTVETHRANLFCKLDVKNVVGLVKKALEWGFG